MPAAVETECFATACGWPRGHAPFCQVIKQFRTVFSLAKGGAWFGELTLKTFGTMGEPPRYRWHLGCILLKMPAISLRTGGRLPSLEPALRSPRVSAIVRGYLGVSRQIIAAIWVAFFSRWLRSRCQQNHSMLHGYKVNALGKPTTQHGDGAFSYIS